MENILRLKPQADYYGMPMMVEPLCFRPDEDAGGYMVNGDLEKITHLVRQAVELEANIIKAEPHRRRLPIPQSHRSSLRHPRPSPWRRPVSDEVILQRTRDLITQGASGIVYGRNVIQPTTRNRITQQLMDIVHRWRPLLRLAAGRGHPVWGDTQGVAGDSSPKPFRGIPAPCTTSSHFSLGTFPMLEKLTTLLESENLLNSKGGSNPIPTSTAPPTSANSPWRWLSPRTTEQISACVKLAHETSTPVITRGSGAGLSGGTVPTPGAIVLCLVHMTEIISVDPANLTLRAQPGAITADIDAAASAHGLFYPPDPGSMKISTIGGNVAENSGGLRGLKYGVTHDYVMALTVVLPDGTIATFGNACVKDVAGYSMKDLFIGSRRRPGIITEVLLKLVPRPAARRTMLATFASMEAAAKPFPPSSPPASSLHPGVPRPDDNPLRRRLYENRSPHRLRRPPPHGNRRPPQPQSPTKPIKWPPSPSKTEP